jgi:prepilin-type N-terminal cleavage/methylation domain-containing protein
MKTVRFLHASTAGSARRSRGSEAGFTLIELVVALLVFTVAVMGLASTMAVAVASDTHAGEQTRALALASQRLEEIKAIPYTAVASEPVTSVTSLGVEGSGPYKRTVTVVEGAEGANTKSVTVSVQYGAGREGTRKVELYTLMYAGS